MDQSIYQVPPIKSALFVDFDNIYIGLGKTDPLAAERFASDPARWLAWLEKGLPAVAGNPGAPLRPRSILIRRCYPNPDAGFRRFRSFFTSAAFSVIDCPSLTRAGKNSADIYMVMDILDTLNHRTAFDEFIIFSGDSDFMPVLLRLRAHDRRTTTLGIDFMPPAYRASCDLVISEEDFIEEALGISNDGNCGGNGVGRSRVSVNTLKEMATRVYNAACSGGEVAGADLPDILKDFREFRESNNWLGFGTSQRLAEALICSEPRLEIVRVNPLMYKVMLKPEEMKPLAPIILSSAEKVEKKKESAPRSARLAEKSSKTDWAVLRNQIVAVVKELAEQSDSAILLARVSQHVVSKLGPQVLETQWAGTGSFKRLLQSTEDLGLEITTNPEPGYLYDPARHAHPALGQGQPVSTPKGGDGQGENGAGGTMHRDDTFLLQEQVDAYEDEEEEDESYEESLPSLEEFARRVSQVTGAPGLTSDQYALVFQGMIEEMRAIADGEKSYSTYQSSKSVSDWCSDQGENIARGDVVLIFKGIIFQDGVRFSKLPGSYSERDLAEIVRDNIHALCRRARMELSEYEEHLLDEWILGALEEEDGTDNDEPAGNDSI